MNKYSQDIMTFALSQSQFGLHELYEYLDRKGYSDISHKTAKTILLLKLQDKTWHSEWVKMKKFHEMIKSINLCYDMAYPYRTFAVNL